MTATLADLAALPDTLVGEIVAGDLYASPRPAPRHARASSSIGGDLHAPFDRGRGGPGGWIILDEPELHLDEDVMVPDLAGWRVETLADFPETAYFEVAPDWVCEVISAGTARLDRALKLPRYARAGVGHAWIVDPINRTVEVYRRTDAGWLLVGTYDGDTVARLEPFDAIELDLAAWWQLSGRPSPG